MKRFQLEEAIIAASEIIKNQDVYIIGSQSILGSYSEEELPRVASLSNELDVLPIRDDSLNLLANKIDAEAGWGSDFHVKNGYFLDGVNDKTATLPAGWKKRLVKVEARKSPRSTGWCLEPHDACVAKLAANRDKDREFVTALLQDGFVDPLTLKRRIANVPPAQLSRSDRRRMQEYVASYLKEATSANRVLSKEAPLPSSTLDKVWVKAHVRNGKHIAAHWRINKRRG